MNPYYSDDAVTLFHGDCLDVLRSLPDASVDAVVTDPPYGLEFMGKEWDRFGGEVSPHDGMFAGRPTDGVRFGGGARNKRATDPSGSRATRAFGAWCEAWTRECLRVLKPGGHLLAFGGTRTWHRLACAVEDAGFEVRDSIAWLYGSGFPKSLDVSKAIDKAAGAEREIVVGGSDGAIRKRSAMAPGGAVRSAVQTLSDPATGAARTWQGWGTALKPAHEPIVVARKPLAGTVAANVLAHGTGALNVDGCRVEGGARPLIERADHPTERTAWNAAEDGSMMFGLRNAGSTTAGRWPANVVLDESQAAVLDAQSGQSASRIGKPRGADNGEGWGMTATGAEYDDLGGASRFMYVAKADASERVRVNGTAHPTVKPLALMRWLVRLVTPPGGTVLEPFAGSGTTVEACVLEGFDCIAIEREADYLPLIRQRINRRRDPVEAVKATGDDGGLFDLIGDLP